MSIFNQVIAGLTGERSLRQTRDRSISAARKAFDPTVFDPQLDVARQQATQGIDEDVYRRNVLNQLFRPVDASVYGGNQAAAIAGTASVDASRAQAMGQFEGGLAMQDIAARQAGTERVGQLQSQQLQTQAQRDAYTDMIRAEYSAEVDSRRQLLGASVAKFGIEAAGGAGAIGKALGGKLSGGMGALKSLFAKVPELPSIEIPEAVTAGLQKGASFAQQYGDAARTFQEVGMGLGIAPELRPGQGIFGGLPTNPFTKAPDATTDAVIEQVVPQAIPTAQAIPSRSAIPNQPIIMRQPNQSGQPLLPDDIFAQPTITQTGGASGFFESPSGPPTPEQIISGQARQRVGEGVGTFNPFTVIPKAIVNDFSRLGSAVSEFFESTGTKTAPIRLETIQNSPQIERQLVGMIKNQPEELRNYSRDVQLYLLNKYPDLRGLFQ